MFDHVTITASDPERSRHFYDTLLAVLGRHVTHSGPALDEWNDFSVVAASARRPPTADLHIAFVARSRAGVDEFWHTGTRAGYRSDGAPGPRPQYEPGYYGCFLLDPDGNSVEAVHHGEVRSDDFWIDHLWIRVADLTATREFYERVAPSLGLRIMGAHANRFHVAAGDRSSAFVSDDRRVTTGLHIAFPVTGDDAVRRFHRTAITAGGRDNGGPRERPEYHEGYYAAFVLDPDGTNVEAVNHHRDG